MGGLDVLWDEEGPVSSPCPGSSHCNRSIHPIHTSTLQAYVNIPNHHNASSRLNVHLGTYIHPYIYGHMCKDKHAYSLRIHTDFAVGSNHPTCTFLIPASLKIFASLSIRSAFVDSGSVTARHTSMSLFRTPNVFAQEPYRNSFASFQLVVRM